MSLTQMPVKRQRIIMILGLLLVILMALRSLLYDTKGTFDFRWLEQFFSRIGSFSDPLWLRDIAVFLIITFVWWRGISLVGRRVDIASIGLRFRILALIVAPLIVGLVSWQLEWSATPFILLFFFTALVAVVLTRVEHLELSRSGSSFPLGPGWALFVLASAAAIVFVVGILAGLASGHPVDSLIGWLSPIWLALNFLAISTLATISYLSVPLIIIFSWFFRLIDNLLGARFRGLMDNFQLFMDPQEQGPMLEELDEASGGFPLIARQFITILVMFVVIILISYALTRVFRTVRRTSQAGGEIVSPLNGLARMGRLGFGHRLMDRLGLLQRWRTAASIRRIYKTMTLVAADYGYPRAEFETPHEYLDTLKETWPNNTTETRLITHAYTRVRYGEIPETQEELDQILSAWKLLESIRPVAKISDHTEVSTTPKR
jgi:hypothetical protein